MSTQIQRRRGTTAEHSTFTGVEGELTVDTTKDTVVVHDGATVGGHPLQKQYPALGSAAAPTYTFTGDTNTGIYSPGADQLALSTNGTGRLFVDASGRVGIGAVEATYAASVTTSGNNGFLLRTGTSSAVQIYTGNTTGEAAFGTLTNDPLNVITNGSSRIRITSAGLVGIGTSAPLGTLDVNGNIFSSIGSGGYLRLCETDATRINRFEAGADADGAYIRSTYSGAGGSFALRFFAAASERARIDSSGRLLVGTSSRSANITAAFQGNSAGSTGLAVVHFSRGQTFTGANTGLGNIEFTDSSQNKFAVISCLSDAAVTPGSSHPGRLVFSVTDDGAASPTEALRISSNRAITVSDGGNVVLGTTTGTKIGTATTQKLGFYNATPVVQPAAVADATDAATVITQLNDLLAKLRTLGIIAT